ncbi:hypothetical protein PR001_g27769 [Phytophthora rubi]|uniref:Uncharacterized protein n=1 Tax=Phytophthora rubi TaxID=129364 RepID=A0A6A3HJB9_9STRA|nr:hypothetical protein PR001_g27769 [Phytophthora rubi]
MRGVFAYLFIASVASSKSDKYSNTYRPVFAGIKFSSNLYSEQAKYTNCTIILPKPFRALNPSHVDNSTLSPSSLTSLYAV